jgi:hypothetical protein
MITTGEATRPLLRRHPDARLASVPLLEPSLLPYLGLMFGSPVAAAVSLYNALAIRRVGLAVRSLLLGIAGWIGFLLVLVIANRFGADNIAFILGRMFYFAIGGALFFIHRPHHRGHEFLGGRSVPILASYLAAIAISILLPGRVALLLLGVPGVR